VRFLLLRQPPTKDDDNHVHVHAVNGALPVLEVTGVAVKTNGRPSPVSPSSALTGFKFQPNIATWPADQQLKARYVNALKAAGLIPERDSASRGHAAACAGRGLA
jgi:hypothetical protein